MGPVLPPSYVASYRSVIGLTGLGVLTVGVYLQFGLARALILSGSLLLMWALLATWRCHHAT